MKGFPKTIGTRHDVDTLLISQPEKTKAYLKTCLDEVMQWSPCEMLDLEDETHKVVVTDATDTQEETRQQYELKIDPNCKLFRLGLSVADAEMMLDA
jgi:hypothetical protein